MTQLTRRAVLRRFEVEREVVIGAARVDQIVDRGDVTGKLVAAHVGDATFAQPAPELAVVHENRNAVAGEPDVALQAGSSHLERELEGRQRVLRSVRLGAAMGERDRGVEQGRESLLHAGPILAGHTVGDSDSDPADEPATRLPRLPACSTSRAVS